ncbi:MAG: hypothetical protein WB439_07210 [Acidobacteriaceae bacterium]
MKHSFPSSLSVLSLMLGTLALVGCGGAASFSNPGSAGVTPPTTPQLVSGPPVQGSVYGGHAPIQGAHVYLLQPGTSGYGSAATSLLGNNGAMSASGYALAENSGDSAPLEAKYVTTDSSGSFNLTGAYSCTAGQPVYIYAYGGNIGGGSSQNNINIVQLATLGNCPSSGNFSTAGNGALQYVYLNEVSTVATAYTFQPFTLLTNNDAWHIGTGNTTQGLLGIANAAKTAAQLYDIQGGTNLSSSGDGEGHLANYRTQGSGVPNVGNGVVPEATIDTLANILSDCVDSVPATVGTPTTQCAALFAIATNNGEIAGATNKPTDTGTAAINIARFPAGNHSAGTANVDATYASDLFDLQPGPSPYVPDLTNAPNDWTLAINYPYAAVGGYGTSNNDVELAESIQVDNAGQIWITAQGAGNGHTNQTPSADRWSNLGVVNAPNNSPGDYIFGYVSVDGGNNAWSGNADETSGIFYAGSNGVLTDTYGSGYTDAYTIVTNQAQDAFFFASNSAIAPNYGMFEYVPNGSGGYQLSAGSPYNLNATTSTTTNNYTGPLDITGATETHTGANYNYAFNFTPVGGTAAVPLAAGDVVTLALTNYAGTGTNPTAATGWPALTSVTVATVNSTTNPTSFTATGTTATTNSTSSQTIAVTGATQTHTGGNYTYTFAYTGDSGTNPMAVGDTVNLTLANAAGTGTHPTAATGWQNLKTATVASVTGTTGFTATGTTPTTNSTSSQAIAVTGATETNTGGANPTYTYTINFTNTGTPTTVLAVGDTVDLTLANATGTVTNGVGWPNLKTVTVATVNSATNPTSFTATGTTATANGTSTQAITITAATETHVRHGGVTTYTYTFTYTGGTSAPTVGENVNLTLTNAPAGFLGVAATGWQNLTSVTVASANGTNQFTATGTTVTTDSTGIGGGNGATGTGSYVGDSNGATGTGYYLYADNGATGPGDYLYADNGATGTGSYPYTTTTTTTIPGAIPAGENVAHGAIDSNGNLWITTEATPYTIANINSTGTPQFTSITTVEQPEFPAIDASNTAWIPIQETASEIYKVTSSGASTILTSATTGAILTSTFGAAVDGNGNVWFANRCGNYGACATTPPTGANTIFELNGGTGTTPGTVNTAISPGTNYVPEAQYPATATKFTPILNGSLNLAIDPSGNLWITNYTGNSVVEMIGVAAPVVTPLSVAAGTNSLGAKP